MPYSASAIAYAFVLKGIEEGKFVTQMKLQKIVYFAHGYHLAKYGTPLINEEFEAWRFGPVVPEIYQSYKLYGSDYIFSTDLIAGVPKDYERVLQSESATDAINYTWEATKNLTANQLSAWSHKTGSPWAQVYNPEGMFSGRIDNEALKTYFQQMLASRA